MRPGRFDRRVVLDRPDVKGREAILKVHVRGKPLAADVDLSTLAKATPGFAGADIENLVNEAAILAARRNRKSISMAEFTESIERVMMGPERKSRLITPKEKAIVAYHEAGHAIVGHLLENCDPIRKVTIIARGLAGGYTLSLPDEDRHYISRAKFLDDLAFALGGRVAEEIVFGDVTTGASSDLQRVTEIARDMVTRYGMSEKMGPMVYGQRHEMVFLGRDLGEQRDYSDAVALEIDKEVQQLVNTAYGRARDVLTQNRKVLEAIAQRLIEVETIEEEEFRSFFQEQADSSGPGGAPFNPRSRLPGKQDGKDESSSSGAVPAPVPA
jgi:cell division protease FtsH